MFENLRQLCELDGISGREDSVREMIISLIDPFCDWHVDPMGNLIAFKKGKRTPKNKLMVSAHMDEVGMMVTGVTEEGMLRLATVGGIDARVILGRAVRIEGKIPGVIGTKAVHMQSAEERGKATPVDQLLIDIGARSKDEALSHVHLGDSVCFYSDYMEFGDHKIKAKAIDDRFGCAAMVELLCSELEYDLTCTFVVQEEVGLRGAKPAAFSVNPDIALILEATTAGDLAGVEETKRVCSLGKGPVVPFMDSATIYDRELYQLAFSIAKEHEIPCQTKTAVAGGNDAGAISVAGNGVRTLSISVPCRYLHSPSCVIDQRDAEYAMRLMKLFLERAAEL